MKRSHPRTLPAVRLALMLAAFAVAVASPATAQESGSWTIGERVVPAPAGASEELRAALAAMPAPNVDASLAQAPQTEEQWLAIQNATANANLEQMAEAYGLSIEKGEIEGVTVYRVTPDKVDPRHTGHLFLHVHGGAYVLNGGDNSATEAALVAARAGIPALSVDYRMPPKHPFPAAVEDVVTVYRHLLESRSAKSIAIGAPRRVAGCRWRPFTSSATWASSYPEPSTPAHPGQT